MQIVILKDLNPDKGLVVGAVKDWIRPLITEMEIQVGRANGNFDAQGEPVPDKSWYSFDAGLMRSIGRTATRESLRPALPSSREADQEPASEPQNTEPSSTAEAILNDQETPHRAAMADAPRAQRGPGRPRKESAEVAEVLV